MCVCVCVCIAQPNEIGVPICFCLSCCCVDSFLNIDTYWHVFILLRTIKNFLKHASVTLDCGGGLVNMLSPT